jgi:hypothetical protein
LPPASKVDADGVNHEYRLETLPTTSKDVVVTAIHLDDEAATRPGTGKSMVLHVNKSSRNVISETAFQ